MKETKNKIMGLFLALAMLITCLPLNPIAAYAAEGDVEINMINFPDSYFRDYISNNIDTDHNKVLSQEECNKVESISGVDACSSLKGIEYFKKLKYLDCSKNGLMNTLDLSQNPALEELNCKGSGINALDLCQNKALKKLNCQESAWLKTLNLGSKPALEELNCYNSRIKALDLSQSPKLKIVYCSDNQLTELKLGSNPDLEKLNCSNNQLTELDVRQCPKLIGLWFTSNNLRTIDLSNNKALTMLSFGANKIEKIDLSANTKLDKLGGYENPLTSLKIPDNTYSFKKFTPIKYSVKVQSGGSKVSFVVLPQGFDKNRIQGAVTGANLQGDSLTWDRSTKPITFQYKLCDNPKEVADVELTVTEGKTIKNTYNLDKMPEDGYERLTFKSGNGDFIGLGKVYAIDVLRGTSYDDPGLKKQIKSIEDDLRPTDKNKEFDKWDKQVPARGNVVTETFTAVYKDKDVVKLSNDPISPTPRGYTRIIFDAGDGNTIDGNRYKIIDVLDNTRWDDAALRKQIPSMAIYKDASKEFKKWSYEVPTSGNVSRRIFTATYKDAKKVVLPSQENPGEVVKGRVRITFDAGEGNTIDGTHRYKYIDALEKTNWNETDLKKQIPSKAKYKDATNEFYKWNEQVPTYGKVSTKTFTAIYKEKVFDSANVASMVVKTQPTKLSYTEGEKLNLTGLEVTLKDNQGLTKDVAFADFTTNGITAEPANGATLSVADNGKKIKLTKENLAAATQLVVKAANSKTEADYNAAKVAVEALTNSDDKTNLQKRLEEVKKYIDANNAIEALKEKPIAEVTEGDINVAQELINKVKEDWRQNLTDSLNVIRTDKKANDQLTEAKSLVAKAETDKTKEAYNAAKAKVDALANDQNKTDLSGRLEEVDKYIKADDALKGLEGKAIADVTQRELTEAEELIKTVKDQWQQGLKDRLTTLKTNKAKQVAEDELAKEKTEAKQKVESLDKLSQEEKSGYTGRIDQAQNKQDIDSIVLEAQKANAKKKIAGMQNLNATDRKNADKAVDNARTKDEIDQAVSDAEAKNNSGPKVFDSANIVSMVVKTQPTKLSYTEGEALDLSGLEVTLKDNQEVTKDVAFANFAAYNIITTPANGAVLTLADNGKPVALTKGSLQDETANLTVSANVTPPVPNPPVPNPNHPIVDNNDNNNSNDYDRWYITYWAYSKSIFTPVEISTSEKAETTKKLGTKLVIGSKEMIKSIDGIEERITMDVAPFIKNGRTMLPIRFIAEALGFNVVWYNDKRTVVLIDKENVVKIPVATNKIIVNGKEYESDVKPVLKNNRTMLPIANIARTLGLEDGKDIIWDASAKEVIITRKVAK